MEQTAIAESSWRERWAERLTAALWVVTEFLELRSRDEDDLSFDEGVLNLVRPCLPILMHKRAKLLAADAGHSEPEGRWHVELEFYVGRILWPVLGPDARGRRHNRARITALVDRIVVAEQVRLDAAPRVDPPVTWRGETGWAG